jgi:cobalt-zinc-cadmium resistance protein CzcA
MAFAVVIIIAVYLPILFLQGMEGRMFRPMAITVCTALAGSLFLALTMIPTLTSFSFRKGLAGRKGRASEPRWLTVVGSLYTRVLAWAMRFRVLTVATSLAVLGLTVGSLYFIGTEFMPKLDEGSLLVETRKLPGVSLTESVAISKRIEQRLRQFPEIADVVIKIGRPDFATEAMGINEGDTYVLLRPMETWTRFHSKEALIEALDKELDTIPGAPTASRSRWRCESMKRYRASRLILRLKCLATTSARSIRSGSRCSGLWPAFAVRQMPRWKSRPAWPNCRS